MTKHRCPRLPRNTQIEYDWQWKWCWTTKDIMESIEYCPYCGSKLTEPKVTHIEMLSDLIDGHKSIVLCKDKTYEVSRDNEDHYKVYNEYGGFSIVPKEYRGILYKCKEVL